MKRLSILGCFFIMLSLTGCATLFGDNTRTVNVSSTPQGAQIFANGMPLSHTPSSIPITSTWSPTAITVKKPGYVTQTAIVNTTFQPVAVLDILFWPGIIVDLISGDMMKISPDSRNITLDMPRA